MNKVIRPKYEAGRRRPPLFKVQKILLAFFVLLLRCIFLHLGKNSVIYLQLITIITFSINLLLQYLKYVKFYLKLYLN